jgi:hypothetical protein
MTVDSVALFADDPVPRRPVSSYQRRSPQCLWEMKAQQSAKIRELGEALVAAGFLTLDDQAKALGLPRSTTWTILKGNHKGSGLSASIINRILGARQLPAVVEDKVLEYVEDKATGCYGHSRLLRRKFVTRLSAKRVNRTHLEGIVKVQAQTRIVKIVAA